MIVSRELCLLHGAGGQGGQATEGGGDATGVAAGERVS